MYIYFYDKLVSVCSMTSFLHINFDLISYILRKQHVGSSKCMCKKTVCKTGCTGTVCVRQFLMQCFRKKVNQFCFCSIVVILQNFSCYSFCFNYRPYVTSNYLSIHVLTHVCQLTCLSDCLFLVKIYIQVLVIKCRLTCKLKFFL